MNYDLVSDLHIDFFRSGRRKGVLSVDWAAERKSDILVVNGDSANHFDKTVAMLRYAAKVYPIVLVTLGNHEHYDTRRPVHVTERFFEQRLRQKPDLGAVVYLNAKNFHRHGGTVFLGHTGWYNWRAMCPEFTIDRQRAAWSMHMWDSNLDFIMPPDQLSLDQALALVEQVTQFSLDPTVEEIVMVTHMAPRRECAISRPLDLTWQLLSGSYVNTYLMLCLGVPNHKIKHWCYGHVHERRDFVIDGVRYVNNARGYQSEQSKANPWGVVQFDSKVTIPQKF